MTEQHAERDWRQRILERRFDFVPPEIEAAIDFLLNAREPGFGWGEFPGVPTDAHSTALAIRALSATSASHWLLAEVGLAFNGLDESALEHTSLASMCDHLYISRLEHNQDAPDTAALARQIVKRASGASPIPATQLAVAISTLCETDVAAEQAGVLAERLTGMRLLDEGSWPVNEGDAGSLIATALSVEALGRTIEFAESDARHAGLDYLWAAVNARGWEEDGGTSQESFAFALLLRALGNDVGGRGDDTSRYETLVNGAEILTSWRNDDGGWGAGFGSPSTTEHTALAVLALHSVGATAFVPMRLVEAMLNALRSDIRRVSRERDTLQKDVSAEVRRQARALLQERDGLRAENRKLRAANEEVAQLQSLVSSLRRRQTLRPQNLPLDIRDGSETRHWARYGVLVALTGMALTIIFYGSTLSLLIVTTTAVTLFASLTAYSVVRDRRSSRAAFFATDSAWTLGSEHLRFRDFQQEFALMTQELPNPMREELIYRLFDEFTTVPPDVAGRLGENLILRLGGTGSSSVRFGRWIRAVAQLGPGERRLLFDQLRRSLLA